MAIQIKRAYARATPKDGYRVLVDRLWPRGIAKEQLRLDACLSALDAVVLQEIIREMI